MTTAKTPPNDKEAANQDPAPMSREWHWHPDLPVKYAPYWLWPAQPAVVAKWIWQNWLQFSDRSIRRSYCALVWGVPNPSQGEISSNIGRSRIDRKKMAVVSGGGKVALTHFKVVKIYGTAISMVECRLGTGRTHQIRVHMASLGYPVIGDPLYGGGSKVKRQELSDLAHAEIKSLDHQVLHAKILGFVAKSGQEPLFFESNFPSYFSKLIDELDKM